MELNSIAEKDNDKVRLQLKLQHNALNYMEANALSLLSCVSPLYTNCESINVHICDVMHIIESDHTQIIHFLFQQFVH